MGITLGKAVTAKLPDDWAIPAPDPRWHTDPRLTDSLIACREATRAHATSFYFASFPLSPARKHAAFAIYAFCRWVDDVIDETPTDTQPDRASLEAELTRLLDGQSPLPFGPAFAEASRQYAIPYCFYADLIEGCCWDRLPVEIRDFAELERYCYHVASVVGLIMGRVFGLKELAGAPRAIEMGIAMQLTNILRDVGEDLARDRVYLARDELAAHGLDRAFLERGEARDPRWQAFLAEQIVRARAYYASGERGLGYLDPGGPRLCVKLMSRVYGGILEAIEQRKGDVFSGRAYVPTNRKLLIALRTLAR